MPPIQVRVDRRFTAPPDRVYDAWLQPQLIGTWMFGPTVREEKIVHIQVDAKVGGAFSFLVCRDGKELDHVGNYLELNRPRHLAFTWGIAGPSEPSRVSVELAPVGLGCAVTLTHEISREWAAFAKSIADSWAQMFGVLETVLTPPL